MSETNATVGFGASAAFGAHVFRVEIPAARNQPVLITEDYGYQSRIAGVPADEQRVVLRRSIWSAIAETARREFNDRLKAARLSSGRWRTEENLVDKLLGKELCVLAWAAETADQKQLPVICSKWAALRPEERWWLFSMTVAEAGLPGDTHRGWRRSLFHALSDGEKSVGRKFVLPVEQNLVTLPLFADSL